MKWTNQKQKFEIKFFKIISHGSLLPHNAKFGHFTWLFYRGRQRHDPRIITQMYSSLKRLFSDIPVVVLMFVLVRGIDK